MINTTPSSEWSCLRKACLAALARLDGKFDLPELMEFGPLTTDSVADAEEILRDGLAALHGNGCEHHGCVKRIEPGFRFCRKHHP